MQKDLEKQGETPANPQHPYSAGAAPSLLPRPPALQPSLAALPGLAVPQLSDSCLQRLE